MVRCTSKSAFLHLVETGKISQRQAEILEYVYYNPGCTRTEISRYNMYLPINTVAGRVNELIKSRLVFENGCKKDRVTERSANCLFVTKEGKELIEGKVKAA